MKKILLILLLAGSFSLAGQGYVSISGIVTDSLQGFPVVNHPVTIMSDSTYGFFYYNIVYTDSVGFYYDYIPVMNDTAVVIYVSTWDCNDIMLQAAILLNPGINSYTQDFQICISNVICQADFTYLPDVAGPPSFQFFDLSTGDIMAWLWDFGDGTISRDQNPFHIFPEPGTYLTCLTVTGNNCTDTFCQEIMISDTVFLQLYGQVFAGNFPMQQGEVSLFALNPNGTYYPWGNPCPVDSNGIYFFTLVPEGVYYIQAVPYDSSRFFPTYYGDVINWQDAEQLNLGIPENPCNIQLVQVPVNVDYFGEGSISGLINNLGMDRSLAERANMILLDEHTVPLGFCGVNSDGSFEFPSLAFGVYHLKAELAGVSSDNMKFELSPELPHLQVVMNYTGNSVLSVGETDSWSEQIKVFPNPVKSVLNILFGTEIRSEVNIRVYAMSGQQVYSDVIVLEDEGQVVTIPFDQIAPGIYNLRMEIIGKLRINKKIVKVY